MQNYINLCNATCAIGDLSIVLRLHAFVCYWCPVLLATCQLSKANRVVMQYITDGVYITVYI